MRKTGYSEIRPGNEEKTSLENSKSDEKSLPDFTKEVPSSSVKKEKEDSVFVDFRWKDGKTSSLKVKKLCYRQGEPLEELYKLPFRDGCDSFSFTVNNSVYIFRKTWREVAMALYNAYGRIKGVIENIIGYLKTELGNFYIISRVENNSWSFDPRISKEGVSFIKIDSLDSENRSMLLDLVTEKIASLHSNNLIIGNFSLNNLLILEDDLQFTDLRKLRFSRKKSFVIDEFKNIMQYLVAIGIARKEDVYSSIAYYAAQNEDRCREWYCENTDSKSGDISDIAEALEGDILS